MQQDFLISSEHDNLPGKCTLCCLVHQDKVKYPSYLDKYTPCDGKCGSGHTSIMMKLINTQNSSARPLKSTQQSAQELQVPHQTICTVLDPDHCTNCYQHAELSQWQWSLLATHSAIITTFPHNEPVCMPRTLRWDNPKLCFVQILWNPLFDSAVTLACYTCPGHLLQRSNPIAPCPPDIPTLRTALSCFKGRIPNGNH